MEHFAIALRQDPDTQGIPVGQTQYKLLLYADDLVLYVTNPHIPLPPIIRAFREFGALSNFKVN